MIALPLALILFGLAGLLALMPRDNRAILAVVHAVGGFFLMLMGLVAALGLLARAAFH